MCKVCTHIVMSQKQDSTKHIQEHVNENKHKTKNTVSYITYNSPKIGTKPKHELGQIGTNRNCSKTNERERASQLL